MAQETLKLSVDTGSVLVDIDDNGKTVGQFRFNPGDLDILRRYKDVIANFEAITLPENPDEEAILAVGDEIKKQIDYLLNYNVSADIFAVCNPLTPTASGDFYFENVIEGIAGLIEKTTGKRIEKKMAKIRKATKAYT